MDDVTRIDTAAAAAVNRKAVSGLGRSGGPHSLVRRALRAFIHFFSYHFILSRQNIRVSYAGGFRLTVRPTVFHPKFFISSEKFAEFIDTLDFTGKRVCEVGTGTGILALAAARSGAELVVATDINPNASLSANENARGNGLGSFPRRRESSSSFWLWVPAFARTSGRCITPQRWRHSRASPLRPPHAPWRRPDRPGPAHLRPRARRRR